jgi:hypothetical protein
MYTVKSDNEFGLGGFVHDPTVKAIVPVLSVVKPLLTFKICEAVE